MISRLGLLRAEPRAGLAGDCKDWAGKVFICVEIVAPEPGEVEPTNDTEVCPEQGCEQPGR